MLRRRAEVKLLPKKIITNPKTLRITLCIILLAKDEVPSIKWYSYIQASCHTPSVHCKPLHVWKVALQYVVENAANEWTWVIHGRMKSAAELPGHGKSVRKHHAILKNHLYFMLQRIH